MTSEVAHRAEHRRAVRLAVGAREYPLTLILGGAILVVFRGLTVVLTKVINPDSEIVAVDVCYVVMGIVLFGIGLLLRTDVVPLRWRPWVFALAAILMAIGLYINYLSATTALSFAVILLLLTTAAAATLAWLPSIIESVVMLVLGLALLHARPIGQTLDWFMLCVGAAALGLVLLQVRLRTVYELADATADTERVAATDQLTGLLNRHGLMGRAEGVWSRAIAEHQPVFVAFVDIRGLKVANDHYGHTFGDRAIQAAARSVVLSVREGDLVARWGGDELIVIGVGDRRQAIEFDHRLQTQNEWTGEDKARWPGELSVGFADGSPLSDSLESIVTMADHDMYRRRRRE